MDNSQPKRPKISVLLPVYNGESELHETIGCILNQSFSDFELLIMDDASTDQTWPILQRLASRDPRIRLFQSAENQGIVKALNTLASEASGDIFIREDCGDFSHPNRYQLQYDALINNPDAVACVCDYWRLEADGTPLAVETVPPTSAAIATSLRHSNNICHSSFAIRKDAFTQVGGYDQEMYCSQDYDLLLKLLKIGSIIPINKPLVAYKLSPAGITFRNQKKQAAYAELARVRAFGGDPPAKFDYDRVTLSEAEATYHRIVGRLHLAKGRPKNARKHFEIAREKGQSDLKLKLLHAATFIPDSIIKTLQRARGKVKTQENSPPSTWQCSRNP